MQGRRKGGGGNAHQRAVTGENPRPKEQSVATPAVTEKPPLLRLLEFAEHPLFTTPIGIVGGIAGVLSYSPILGICGLCVILAFRRAKVVSGESIWKVQIPAYFVLSGVVVGGLYGLHRVIDRKLIEENLSLSQLIASRVVGIQVTPKQQVLAPAAPNAEIQKIPPPTKKHSAPVPTTPPLPEKNEGPTLQGGFHEVVDQITVETGSIRDVVKIETLKRWGIAGVAMIGDTVISLSLSQDGKLLFSFKGWAGGIPLEVTNNQIKVGDGKEGLIERNYSENAFEIVDKDYQPVFQMICTSASSITINGVFPLGGVSRTTGLPLLAWVSPEVGVEKASQRPADFNLKPIFKYPYWKYPGAFAEN